MYDKAIEYIDYRFAGGNKIAIMIQRTAIPPAIYMLGTCGKSETKRVLPVFARVTVPSEIA